MRVTTTSKAGFQAAFQQAVDENTSPTNLPRTYKVVGVELETGGVVGTQYRVEVEITGSDVD
jgi:hypothetical protein